jgi:hypothetical protein
MLFFFSVLGMEARASHMVGKCSTTELHPITLCFFWAVMEFKLRTSCLQAHALPLKPHCQALFMVLFVR